MSRFFRPTLLLAFLVAGRADASSILVLETRDGAPGPSVAAIEPDAEQDTPAASNIPGQAAPISSSILAVGQPAIAGELTSAIEATPERGPDTLVIRGGIFGEAFRPASTLPAGGQDSAGPVSRTPPPSPVSRPR